MTIRQRILFTAAKVAALIDEAMPATGPDLADDEHVPTGMAFAWR